MKRVIIIHGWGGGPEGGWFDWLKNELPSSEWEIDAPQMPDTDEPKIDAWVSKLKEVVGEVDEDTYFIGHSIGCQTILRFLETLKEDKKIGGAIFVAGWFSLKGLEEGEDEIAKPWIETPIDFEKIKKQINKSTAIFSDNDPYVPLSNTKIFKQELSSKIIIENKKEHFNEVIKFPNVLNSLLEISK